MTHDTGGRWLLLWNAGLLCGLIGLPALLGFFAGVSIESSANMPGLPWRLIFVGVGVLVGAFAAWRTLMPRSTRPPE